jgi:hypothetical protein
MFKNGLVYYALNELNTNTQFAELVQDIVDYCRSKENGEVFDGWDDNVISHIIAYHLVKDTCILCMDDGKITGVAMWYNCNSSDDWSFIEEWHPDDRCGDSVFIAFLFSESSQCLRRMCASLLIKEPSVLTKKIIGLRHRNGYPCRVEYRNSVFKKVLNLK